MQATLNLPAGQQDACADTLTRLPPPFSVRAPVAAQPAGGAPLALSPLATISALAAAQQAAAAAPAPAPATRSRKLLQAGGDGQPAPASGQLPDLMPQFNVAEAGGGTGSSGGTASQVSTAEGDALAAAQAGDQAAIRLLAYNQVRAVVMVCCWGARGMA